MVVRPHAGIEMREAVLAQWYRETLKVVAASLIATWEPLLGVKVEQFFVQKMKTRWGSCNYRSRNIRLNTDLARKPRKCLEYVIVHELVHLLEPSHNSRFKGLMDQFLPQWRVYREELNQMPLGHEEWEC